MFLYLSNETILTIKNSGNKMAAAKNLTRAKIIGTLESHGQELRELGVKRIGLFGSYLKTSNTKKHDLDFLVKFSHPTFDSYTELKFLLEKIFRKKVDLVIEDNLKPSIEHVKEKAVYAKAI